MIKGFITTIILAFATLTFGQTMDMELTAITTNNIVLSGLVDITGTVTNLGTDPVTSIDIIWDDGSGPNTQTFPVNLNTNDTYDFIHTTQLNTIIGNVNDITVCVSALGDLNILNDCKDKWVSAASSLVSKIVVAEEITGEWCGWCPRGAVYMAQMDLDHPDDYIGISVHNLDGMAFASYDVGIEPYIPHVSPNGGLPTAGIDRVLIGDPSNLDTLYAQRVGMVPPAEISVSSFEAGDTIYVDINADFVAMLSGDYRLAAVIIENAVLGDEQVNYYGPGDGGAIANPNSGSMPNFDWNTANEFVSPVWHDRVARALGEDEVNGAAGSLPSVINDGDQHTYSYFIPKDPSWENDNLRAIGMLVDANTGEILNANSTAVHAGYIGLEESTFDVQLAPNPTNGLITLTLNIQGASETNVVILDEIGREIFNSGTTNLASGSSTLTVDLSEQLQGIYFAKIDVNGQSKTVKIVVSK
ncbi:MAG: T9SS type A sorting domain-containing protein [Crocinitomicaceae bacterium]|nr:T9SS type A sorting domain-containing protein [Crocinitomicaceae bacterium]